MNHHLAQINIARGKGLLDAPVMQDFVELLDAMNALADVSPGFIWRLKTDDGDATSIRAFDDPTIIVNMSVWTDVEALKEYTYKSSHAYAFKKRNEWFHKSETPTLALWWIPEGTLPTIEEGKSKLETLARLGPTLEAFTFRQIVPKPSEG